MTTEDLTRLMERQKMLEILAHDTYTRFAAELKPGPYKDLFLRIALDEEEHARLVREIIERLH